MFRAILLALISVSCLAALSDINPPVYPLNLRRGHALLVQKEFPGAVHNADSVCEWDDDAKECVVSLSAAAGLLADSENAYAQFVAGFAECEAANGNEEACNAVGKCVWDPHTSLCILVDFDVSYKESVCVVDAPAIMRSSVASPKCAAYMTQLPCIMDHDCEWSQDELKCSADFSFYVGLSFIEIQEAAEGVIAYKGAKLREQFPLYFNFSDPAFDWNDVLDWDIPETDCPEWSDQLICKYVDGIFQNVAVGFYCGAKYHSPLQFAECATDPLCEFQLASAECRAPDVTYAPGARAGIREMVDDMAAPVDKELWFEILDCLEATTKETCPEGCLWTEDEQECNIHGDQAMEIVASPGGSSSADPICIHADVLAESGCLDLINTGGIDACQADSNCSIQVDGGCSASVQYLISKAVEMDEELTPYYILHQTRCRGHKTKRACESARSAAEAFVY